MNIFSRKSNVSVPQRASAGSPAEYIGRKFRSSLSLQEYLDN